ncbi:MAG: 50S ribosomal protein L10, partial [Armatimonadetes bacterium]|nr:50S ribosomal protein L10 [Armatimonadota bacterium]
MRTADSRYRANGKRAFARLKARAPAEDRDQRSLSPGRPCLRAPSLFVRECAAMPKAEKAQAVADFKEKLNRARSVVLTDFRSLKVSELDTLRGSLRKAGAEYHIVKNTLLTIAAGEAGVDGLAPYLTGPTAIAIGFDDPVAPAKAIQDFIRQFRKLEVKGGYVEGRTIDADG